MDSVNSKDSSETAIELVARNVVDTLLANRSIAVVPITEEHLRNQFTDWFIKYVESMPSGFALWLYVEGYDDDPREVWQVPEVRAFVKKALMQAPHIVGRFEIDYRRVLRWCFCDVLSVNHDGGWHMTEYVISEQWRAIAQASHINPEE